MKLKPIALLATVAATLACASAPAQAHASTRCAGAATEYSRGGNIVKFDRYHALGPHEASEVTRQMNCASVRYVMNTIRRKIRAQRTPSLRRAFFDGYVTWYCYNAQGHTMECVEYDSNTGFTFRGRVY